MKYPLKMLAVAFLLMATAYAQNWTTITASNITDLNQQKLAAGQLCFLITDQNDNPISVGVGGGGQSLKRAYCSPVANGAVTSFTVPNPANTLPSGIYYRVTAKDTSTGAEVLRYTGVTFAGASFSFDAYMPNIPGASYAPLTGNNVSGNLAVSGNANITGTLTVGSFSPTVITSGQFTGNTANPAQSGIVRLASPDAIKFRNNANSADINGLSKNSSDAVVVGGPGGMATAAVNSVVWAGNGVTLASAYALLPSTGGTVMVPPNYSETLAANLTFATNNTAIMFMGPATVNQGSFQIIIGPNIQGFSITSPLPYGAAESPSGNEVQFIYTGSSAAWVIGGPLGAATKIKIAGVFVDIRGAGASAIGIKASGYALGVIDQVAIDCTHSATSQIGIQFNPGSIPATENTISNSNIQSGGIAVQYNGAGWSNYIYNTQIINNVGTPGTTIGVDYEDSAGFSSSNDVVDGGFISGFGKSINYGGTAANNYARFFSSVPGTNDVVLASGTSRNRVVLQQGSYTAISDSGTQNRVEFVDGTVISGYSTLLNQQGPAAALTGNGTDQTVFSYTLPANTVQKGKGIRITLVYLHSVGTASTTYKLTIGGTTIESNAFVPNDNSHRDKWIYEIYNDAGSQVSQGHVVRTLFLNLSGFSVPVIGIQDTSAGGILNPNINFTNSQIIKWTFNVANTDKVTPVSWQVELIQ